MRKRLAEGSGIHSGPSYQRGLLDFSFFWAPKSGAADLPAGRAFLERFSPLSASLFFWPLLLVFVNLAVVPVSVSMGLHGPPVVIHALMVIPNVIVPVVGVVRPVAHANAHASCTTGKQYRQLESSGAWAWGPGQHYRPVDRECRVSYFSALSCEEYLLNRESSRAASAGGAIPLPTMSRFSIFEP